MILFFHHSSGSVYAVESEVQFSEEEIHRLVWLFGGAEPCQSDVVNGYHVGPRREMVTPWSTNAVEITQNMNVAGIRRIEEFFPVKGADAEFDPMLQALYEQLDQKIFDIDRKPEPIISVKDIRAYNEAEGLALNEDEISYLEGVSERIGRPLTDSELFGFSQVNSEHCRHKIFGGTFIIDGEEKESSLFNLIKRTSAVNPNLLVSAYKDNVAFIQGPKVEQFAPAVQTNRTTSKPKR